MIGQKFVVAFLLLAICNATPELSIRVNKSHFLWIFKWANFRAMLNIQGKAIPQDSAQSKFYIFAGYFDKIAAGDLGVALSFRVNDVKEYAEQPLTKPEKAVDGNLDFATPSGLLSLCAGKELSAAVVDKVDLVDTTFKVFVTVHCGSAADLSAKGFKHVAEKNAKEATGKALEAAKKEIHHAVGEVQKNEVVLPAHVQGHEQSHHSNLGDSKHKKIQIVL